MVTTNTVYDPDADEKPVRHDVPSDEELRRLTGINEEQESAMDREAKRGLADQEKNLFNASGDETPSTAASSSSDLATAETAAASNTLGAGFNPKDTSRGERLKGFFWGTPFRKRSTVGGGIAGLIIGGGFFGLTIISGPLELIHMAQLLQHFHFASMQDTQDNRLSKIARYIRDPSKPENTRLGFVGNKVADSLEAKMNETGVESAYTPELGYFDGYVIDTNNSNYKDLQGKSPEEVKQALSEQLGVPPDSVSIPSEGDLAGKITIDASKLGGGFSGYRNTLKLNETMLKEAGYSKLVAAIGARIMGRRAGISWHPISKLDAKILQGGIDAIKKIMAKEEYAQIEEGSAAAEVQLQEDTKNANGQTDPAAAQNANGLSGELSSTASDAGSAAQGAAAGDTNSITNFQNKLAVKASAGGVALVGLVCMIQGLGAHINQLRYAEVIMPMLRMGMEAVTVGNQVMSGQDISAQQVGFFKQQLDQVDSNGNVVSTWNQARSIQYEEGQPQSGPDIPAYAKVFNASNPFAFLSNVPGLSGVCSVLGSTAGQVLGFVLGGGPISAIVSYIGGKALLQPALSSLAHWLAGTPVDPFATGADRGNFMNYGVRLAANDQAVAAGGVALSSADESSLKLADNQLQQANFSSQSLAYKLLNPYDNKSLISHVIDQQDPNVSQNVSRVASSFANLFLDAFKVPETVFGSLVHADTANASYDYGFPAYGFSESDQTNSLVSNPFQNASVVASLLDSPNGQQYIDKASRCFGITIAKDSDQRWGVSGGSQVTNLYDSNYNPGDCATGDDNWLRVRFFILDTETIESYNCYQGDAQSCTNVSFND